MVCSPIVHAKKAPLVEADPVTKSDQGSHKIRSKCKWTRAFTTERPLTISLRIRTAHIEPQGRTLLAYSSAIPRKPLTASHMAPVANTTNNPSSKQSIHHPDTMTTCTTHKTCSTVIRPTVAHPRASTLQALHHDPKPNHGPPSHHQPRPARAAAEPLQMHRTPTHRRAAAPCRLAVTHCPHHRLFPRAK